MPRRATSLVLPLAAAFAVASLAAVALAARPPQQPAKAPPPQQPTFQARTLLVRLDVYPTAKGRPVGDLTAADFDVREDGVAQTVASLEHVVIHSGTSPDLRAEPRDLRESLQMARDPRTRLFVLYLDSYHVTDEWGWRDPGQPIRGGNSDSRPARRRTATATRVDAALAAFLNGVIGPDDMVAALTPDMDPRELTFTRRGASIDDYLRSIWARDPGTGPMSPGQFDLDPEEITYQSCYPPQDPEVGDFAARMIARRREEITFRTLRGLVERLGELRPERKALLVVTEGWSLFRPDRSLARPWGGQVTNPTGVYVGPDGKPRTGSDPRTFMRGDQAACETARQRLANLDDLPVYRDLLGEANRANVSFYPINPVKPGAWTPSGFTAKTEMLHDMATSTDGRAVISSFDLGASLQRIADDLSEYYLIGYYSTNTKMDGGYRRITVTVKRPGVEVRARPGYLAPTASELKAAAAATAPIDAEKAALDREVGGLDAIRDDRVVRLDAGYGGRSAAPTDIWVVGEIDLQASRTEEWKAGAVMTASLIACDGRTIAERTIDVATPARNFLAILAPDPGAGSETCAVRLVARPLAGTLESRESIAVAPSAPSALAIGRPVLVRRGPFSGPGRQPTADPRLRRQETVALDVPVPAGAAFDRVTAQILDRGGKALPVPVGVAERTDAGRRWFSAQVALAPLARGDYLIRVEFERGSARESVVRSIRVLP